MGANVKSETHEGFLDLKIDTAFKFIFSKKEFLIDLLNDVLNDQDPIVDIIYNNTEQIPEFKDGKKVIFDLNCTTSHGQRILIEMQYKSHEFFRERTLYYMARKIDYQLKKPKPEDKSVPTNNRFRYNLDPTYGIFLMGFNLEKERPRFLRDVVLCDVKDNYRQFTDALRMIYIELSEAKKMEDCTNGLEYWSYVIQNSKHMQQMPFTDKKPIFGELAQMAKFHLMSPEEQLHYEEELDNSEIYDLTLDYAKKEGRAEGRAEGEKNKAIATAKFLKTMGKLSMQEIAEATGLTTPEIETL